LPIALRADKSRRINGAAAVELQIAVSDEGIPRVISEKQKTLRKEKGTMQPR
jgi:hypothetical protein